jgi:predicted TIM-barrel fold metal-dependent hydrolase
VLGALLDAFGPGRLCWSAFYPSLRQRPYAESVALVRDALSFLPARDQEQILGGAARSLYPSLAVGAGPAGRAVAQ